MLATVHSRSISSKITEYSVFSSTLVLLIKLLSSFPLDFLWSGRPGASRARRTTGSITMRHLVGWGRGFGRARTRFGGGSVRRRPSTHSPAFSISRATIPTTNGFAASRPRWFHRHNCKAASSSTNPAAMVTGNRCFVAFLIRRQAAGQPPCAPAACAARPWQLHPTGSPVVHQPRVQRHSNIGGIMMRAPALMSDLSDCKCAETRAQLRHLSAAAALLAIA